MNSMLIHRCTVNPFGAALLRVPAPVLRRYRTSAWNLQTSLKRSGFAWNRRLVLLRQTLPVEYKTSAAWSQQFPFSTPSYHGKRCGVTF